jgi:putative addiction module component (TIGR02574 family)
MNGLTQKTGLIAGIAQINLLGSPFALGVILGTAVASEVVMARAVSEIEQEIRALSDTEKERLLRALLEELDGPPEPGVEQAWLDEIRRRGHELDAGLVDPIAADRVFADIRAKFSHR